MSSRRLERRLGGPASRRRRGGRNGAALIAGWRPSRTTAAEHAPSCRFPVVGDGGTVKPDLRPERSSPVLDRWLIVADSLRRSWRVAPLGAAAVVVLVGAVAWFVGVSRTADLRSVPAMSTPAVTHGEPVGTSTQDPNYDATVRAVEQLVASVPEPAGATQLPTAPTADLAQPLFRVDPGFLVARTTFWTAPLSQADAITFYRNNRVAGSTEVGSASKGTAVQSVMFGVPAGQAFTGPTIDVDVVPYQAGVAVRVDAMAVWIPTKPASEYIGSVDSVDVTVDRRGAAPTVSRTLTGAPAQRLAAAVDALRPEPHYDVRECPNDRGFLDTLVFHRAGRTITAVATVQGCGGVAIDADAVAQPRLGGYLDAQVLAELGLPSRYGY
jgi:hypothetical protein